MASGTTLVLAGSPVDLAVLAERASRHEPTTVVRLVADGLALAAFVDTPFDCLGLRVTRLAEPASLDVVVEAVGLGARARSALTNLEVPPALPALAWTAGLPPRSGWEAAGTMRAGDVRARVAADTAAFQERAASVPAGRGAQAAVEAIATDLWSRPLHGDHPGRLGHAARYLGFLPSADDAAVTLRHSGAWRRLDTDLGVTLARVGDVLGLLVR